MSAQRIITRLALFLFILLSASMAQAASVLLVAYIESPDYLAGPDGVTPLADGSIVYLIGRPTQGVSPPPDGGMPPYGGSLIASGTTGDDVLLATIRIGEENLDPNTGRFEVTFEFPDTHPYQVDNIGWAYIRFFDTDTTPLGSVYWGVSDVIQIQTLFQGLDVVQFGSGAATNLNTFAIIPEPGTGQMLLLFFAIAFGVHQNFKRKKKIDGKFRMSS